VGVGSLAIFSPATRVRVVGVPRAFAHDPHVKDVAVISTPQPVPEPVLSFMVIGTEKVAVWLEPARVALTGVAPPADDERVPGVTPA